MKLEIGLVPGFNYSTSVHDFPVDVKIFSSVPVEISVPVDVAGALLTRIDGHGSSFGYVKRVTPARRQSTFLSMGEPLHMRVNVLENDDDFSDFFPGQYKCEIKVELSEKVGDRFRIIELHGNITVALT